MHYSTVVEDLLKINREKIPDKNLNSFQFCILAFKIRYNLTLDLRFVRTKRYKAIFEVESGTGEIYDLQEDPFEINNLFSDAGYKNIQNKLREMMLERPGDFLEIELPRVAIN
ncbi:MAG TPA: DUF4976 domain-containing protein [Rhodospirillales bacterium]|nr:DUF4976 domain-containing protein [Rhodospirillales bacterium]HIL77146.1 DUF4976 domain-containing protein [Rhodospirillales bacterium]